MVATRIWLPHAWRGLSRAKRGRRPRGPAVACHPPNLNRSPRKGPPTMPHPTRQHDSCANINSRACINGLSQKARRTGQNRPSKSIKCINELLLAKKHTVSKAPMPGQPAPSRQHPRPAQSNRPPSPRHENPLRASITITGPEPSTADARCASASASPGPEEATPPTTGCSCPAATRACPTARRSATPAVRPPSSPNAPPPPRRSPRPWRPSPSSRRHARPVRSTGPSNR